MSEVIDGMKPDKYSQSPPKSAVEALDSAADLYADLAGDLQEDLAEATEMEDLLELAERSSLETLAKLPLSPYYCPFCSIHNPGRESCKGCEYASERGICSEAGSIYDQILDAHYALVGAVQEFREESLQKTPLPPEKVEAAKDALQDHALWLMDLAERFKRQVRGAGSSEEIMSLKKAFMIDLVRGLPLMSICNRCGVENQSLIEAEVKALFGLSRYWAAA